MEYKQRMVTLDLEGVLIPEIWHEVARVTSDSAFLLTTRDVSDYDELMRMRIEGLHRHNLTLHAVRDIIAGNIAPFTGAVEFLRSLRRRWEVVILSDTFVEFFEPLRAALDYPVIFCNALETRDDDMVVRHIMRMQGGKQAAVRAFNDLNFVVAAAGDSFNDVGMLREAQCGIFFKPSAQVLEQCPDIPARHTYEEVLTGFENFFLSGAAR